MLGVSPDDLGTHKKFAEQYGITFPLISDPLRSIQGLYGQGRVTYLIDKDGVVRFIQNGVPKNRKFLKELKKLQR